LPPGGHLSTLWPSLSATAVSRKPAFHHLRARRASWQPTGVLSAISAEVSGLISLNEVAWSPPPSRYPTRSTCAAFPTPLARASCPLCARQPTPRSVVQTDASGHDYDLAKHLDTDSRYRARHRPIRLTPRERASPTRQTSASAESSDLRLPSRLFQSGACLELKRNALGSLALNEITEIPNGPFIGLVHTARI